MSCCPLLPQQFYLSKEQACGKQRVPKSQGAWHLYTLQSGPVALTACEKKAGLQTDRQGRWVLHNPPFSQRLHSAENEVAGRSMPPFSSAPSMWVNMGGTKPCFVAESRQEEHMCFHSLIMRGDQSLAHRSKNWHSLLLMPHCVRKIDHHQIEL